MTRRQGRITLWEIEVFVATADERSVTAAAHRLGTSAATVSQQLSNLERDLGTTLVNRAERPLTLTPAGATFLRRATAILGEAEQARSELGLAEQEALGRFRLGVIEDLDADVTPRLLQDMAEDLKGTRVLLETGPSHRLHDQLEARALDVIVAADLGQPDKGFEVHPLMREPFLVAAPRGAFGSRPGLRALREMPRIQYTTRHHLGQAVSTHLSRQNLDLPSRLDLDNYHAILALVAAGAGWAILTPLGWHHARRFHEAVEMLPLPGRPLTRTISLVARPTLPAEMAADLASRLRALIADMVIAPAVGAAPWLSPALRLL